MNRVSQNKRVRSRNSKFDSGDSNDRCWPIRLSNHRGQAMVEFVILLIFIMALCIGMCASIRLLTFQFWAQQEARFLAYEQTWVANSFNSDSGGDPVATLDETGALRRPAIVSEREAQRTVDSAGSASGLLALNLVTTPSTERVGSEGAAPVMYAGEIRSGSQAASTTIWNRKSSVWFASVKRSLEMIPTAFALQRDGQSEDDSKLEEKEANETTAEEPEFGVGGKAAAKALSRILSRGGFGTSFCAAIDGYVERNPEVELFKALRKDECAEFYDREFAEHVVANIDIAEFFRDYGIRLGATSGIWDSGSTSTELESAVRNEVANQFYSFFDTIVKLSRSVAVIGLIGGRLDVDLSLVDESVGRMMGDLRYLGSTAAIVAILAEAANVSFTDPTARNWQETLNTETDIVELLHTDAQDILPVVNPFWLNPLYLPVPPVFGRFGVALQESVMKNVLFNDASLKAPLITEGNKSTEVHYQIVGGLFPAARKYIAGIEEGELAAKHYLITEPWHIPRRVSPRGDYREKGTQEDTINMDTDEAMLRRRVEGMWFFPSDFPALLEPIAAIPGLSFLSGAIKFIEPFGSILGSLKHYLLVDNPFNQIATALSKIPIVGEFVPTLPLWPAVRPDAYPGSLELSGNKSGDPDMLMGEERDFQDYVDEQKEFDPPPNPTFHDE